jgi:F-type H+-transporting ATPase subunit b
MARKLVSSSLLSMALLALTFGFHAPVAHAQEEGSRPSTTQAADPTKQQPGKQETEQEEGDEYRHSPMVTKLGSFLGMKSDKAATTFTLSNLFILLAGVLFLLYKNLPKTFRSRSEGIQKQIVDARAATLEAKTRLSSVEERLSKLDEQIAGMRTQAEADGAREEERLKAAIEDEKKRILSSAELEISSATISARRELQKYAAELAVDQAARKLVVTPEADRYLVEGFAERLQTLGKGEN